MVNASFTVVGEALVDLVESPSSRGTFTAHAGGSLYNVALTLARLGEQVSLVARTGSDAFGRMLEDKARASGVGFDRWQIVREPTTLAVAGLDEAGRAHYDFYLDGTAGLAWDDGVLDLVPSGGVLHVGSLASWRPPSGPFIEALQRRLHALGDTLVSYDPNVRPALIADPDEVRASIERCLGAAHLVKASDEDVEFLYPGVALAEVAARWCGLGALLVVVTLGSEGAVAYAAAGEVARCAGAAIAVADTVGAGDSFAGGLLAGLASGGVSSPGALADAIAGGSVIHAALAQAVLVSAMTCERAGADPPTRTELDQRVSSGS